MKSYCSEPFIVVIIMGVHFNLSLICSNGLMLLSGIAGHKLCNLLVSDK